MKLVGIILVVLGVLGFVYQGFTYTHQEQAAKIGPLEINTEKKEAVPIPPIVSGIAIVAGIALVVVGKKP